MLQLGYIVVHIPCGALSVHSYILLKHLDLLYLYSNIWMHYFCTHLSGLLFLYSNIWIHFFYTQTSWFFISVLKYPDSLLLLLYSNVMIHNLSTQTFCTQTLFIIYELKYPNWCVYSVLIHFYLFLYSNNSLFIYSNILTDHYFCIQIWFIIYVFKYPNSLFKLKTSWCIISIFKYSGSLCLYSNIWIHYNSVSTWFLVVTRGLTNLWSSKMYHS